MSRDKLHRTEEHHRYRESDPRRVITLGGDDAPPGLPHPDQVEDLSHVASVARGPETAADIGDAIEDDEGPY